MHQKIKLLLLKVFLLGVATLGTIEIIYRFNPNKARDLEISYTASIIDKYQRLQSLPSPKIVLVAGSNFAYGINSEMIEQSLQKPVANMALHYDYGTDFMFRQVENELHAGDEVVMGFEYIIEKDGNIGEKIKMATLFPKAYDWFDYKNPIDYIRENLKERISVLRILLYRLNGDEFNPSVDDTTSIFFRKAINQHGDMVSHLNNPSVKIIPPALIDDRLDMLPAIENMNDFYKSMQAKGVKVYYTYPSYALSDFERHKGILQRQDSLLRSHAKFPVLGNQQDFVFADSLCQDMVYHLNAAGRNIRTQKLIDLLKNR